MALPFVASIEIPLAVNYTTACGATFHIHYGVGAQQPADLAPNKRERKGLGSVPFRGGKADACEAWRAARYRTPANR